MITNPQLYRIPLSTTNTLEVIWVKDILYLEGMENYCKVNLTSGERYVSTQSLGQLFTTLKSFGFHQCHKSYVVNLDSIIRYRKEGQVELNGGAKVPVARRRKEEFVGVVQEWLSGATVSI